MRTFLSRDSHPTLPHHSRSKQEWRRGWRVVIAAGLGYGTGGAMLLLIGGLFIAPMREALGWSTTAVTIVPIITLVWAACNPMAGAAIDRVGSRQIAIVGMLGLALCAVLLAGLPVNRSSLYGTAALAGVFAAMTSVATYTRGIASWFQTSVGLAFGVALSGSAVVAIVATPLVGISIAEFGWRAGFLLLAAIILFISFPAVWLFYRERNDRKSVTKDVGQVHGSTAGEAFRDLRLWCFALAFTFACIPIAGTNTHLQPLLAQNGLPLAKALSLGVVYAVAISAGKVIGGVLLDRFWPFAVAAVIPLIASAGSFFLAFIEGTTAFAIAALVIAAVGLAAGAEADFVGFFVLRSFGMRAFSTIVGVLATVVTLGTALGAWLYGWLFDLYGSYQAACVFGSACLFASACTILLAGYLDSASGYKHSMQNKDR